MNKINPTSDRARPQPFRGFTTERVERLRTSTAAEPPAQPPAETLGTLVGQAAAVMLRFQVAAVAACRQALHEHRPTQPPAATSPFG